MQKPVRSKVYRSPKIESTRWDAVVPRSDDIVVATPTKAGTTWTLTIVAHLLFPDEDFPEPIPALSPWIDNALPPLEEVLTRIDAQRHLRFLKSHLALDGIRYLDETRYIVVCRDGRDIAMSMWNHFSNYSGFMLGQLKAGAQAMGREYPDPPADLATFWRNWCTRSWFDWQHDGWPNWSDLHVMQSWWDYRHLPNIELFHYADMLADTPGAIRRMANCLDITVDDARIAQIADTVSFANMKANSERYVPAGGVQWNGGGQTFFNKGTNGRWRDEIPAENLALYDQAADRVLSPDCRCWTESGGPLP